MEISGCYLPQPITPSLISIIFQMIVSASSIKVLLLLSLDEGFIIIVLFLYVYVKVNCLLSLTLLHVLMLLFHCYSIGYGTVDRLLLDNASHVKTESGIKTF